jgi:hypothetical protein
LQLAIMVFSSFVTILSIISKGFVHISLHNLCNIYIYITFNAFMHVSLFIEINWFCVNDLFEELKFPLWMVQEFVCFYMRPWKL